ncbi:MAG: hypothetical protein J0I12_33340 [Candidatus Eremiobacteraeota bacterium]|nr:hypothetical protein [Candidatus Eremiobacteraeota bacterium]
MSDVSELEKFLLEQVGEGQHDSGGKFTLARSKALEKLANFQLPRETAWVSKLVQAAVAGGSSGMAVRQTNRDTFFVFEPPADWTLAGVEEAFYDPEVSSDRALDHFKRGLWPVSIRDARPFRLVLPGIDQALIWNGQDFQRRPCEPVKYLELTVSMRSRWGGVGLPLFGGIEAARANAATMRELCENCFTCPIPLKVDGRRLDALQGCPMHGFSPSSYPVRVALTDADLPGFRVPRLTFGGYEPVNPGHSKLNTIYQPKVFVPQRIAVALVVCASIEKTGVGDTSRPIPLSRSSTLSWVRDGVVVGREALTVSQWSCAAGVFLSADGLDSDLTGFGLIRTPEVDRRKRIACMAACDLLQDTSVSLDVYVRTVLHRAYWLGGLMFVGGLAMCLVEPISGFFLAGGGATGSAAVTAAVNVSAERALEVTLQDDLQRLQSEWRRQWGA